MMNSKAIGRLCASAIAIVAAAVACSADKPQRNSQGGTAATGGESASTGGASGTGGTGPNITLRDSGVSTIDGGCAKASVQSTLLPANILFLLDRSGSMNCNLPPITSSADCEANPPADESQRADTTAPSKWDVVTAALKNAFKALPKTASVGLSYFNDNDDCGVYSWPSVGVNPLDDTQIAALDTSLSAVPPPKGGTPIIGATVLAYKHLHEQVQLTGNEFVVLLTDGAETCDPDKISILQTEVPKALSVNIRTFVIGAPGSEPARAMLSHIAYLGGTARSPDCSHDGTAPDVGDCHFDMTMTTDLATDLAAALTAISGKALDCEFDVPQADPNGQPVAYDRVNVNYTKGDGTMVQILQDPKLPCDDGAEGWQYEQNNEKIVLCGSVCNEVKSDQSAKVDIILGCQTVVK